MSLPSSAFGLGVSFQTPSLSVSTRVWATPSPDWYPTASQKGSCALVHDTPWRTLTTSPGGLPDRVTDQEVPFQVSISSCSMPPVPSVAPDPS